MLQRTTDKRILDMKEEGFDDDHLPIVPVDCKTCNNRGVVRGYSQEAFCSQCIYGTSWKRNWYSPIKESYHGRML